MRQRKNVAPRQEQSSPTPSMTTQVQPASQLPPMAIAYLIAALIVGVIVGKFIL